MKPAYEANILRVFAKLVEDGAVYQSRKPSQWSYGAYTALAEAEIDYKEKISSSVFVRFPLLDNPLDLKASMVIWTTTPWTLPANVGIALHPRFTYVAGKFMKDGQTETLIILKDLLDAFAQKTAGPWRKPSASSRAPSWKTARPGTPSFPARQKSSWRTS